MESWEKSLRSVEPYRIAFPADPAIDPEKSNLNLYDVTRNHELLVPYEGEQIQWYVCKRLSRERLMEIDVYSTSDKIAKISAFREAVIAVENPSRMGDGSQDQMWRPKYLGEPEKAHKGGMSREEVALWPLDEIYDIGDVVIRRSLLAPGRPVFFPPLDSSVLAIAAASFLRVGRSPDQASRPDTASDISEQTATTNTP